MRERHDGFFVLWRYPCSKNDGVQASPIILPVQKPNEETLWEIHLKEEGRVISIQTRPTSIVHKEPYQQKEGLLKNPVAYLANNPLTQQRTRTTLWSRPRP